MDHRWGRNVFEFGLWNSGATLAARFRPPASNVILTNALTPLGQALQVYLVPYGGSYVYVFEPTVLMIGTKFPYGNNVDPDAPV